VPLLRADPLRAPGQFLAAVDSHDAEALAVLPGGARIGLGFPQTRSVGFSGRSGLRSMTVVGFDLGRREVVELALDPLLVEPRRPAAGGDLQVFEASPRAPLAARAAGLRCSSVLNSPITDSAMALS
jgi:hypothetical protein